MAYALCDPLLHSSLQFLWRSFGYLDIVDSRHVLRPGGPFPTAVTLDPGVNTALNTLADVLLLINTNVTYPMMKALLLVTGLAPYLTAKCGGGIGIIYCWESCSRPRERGTKSNPHQKCASQDATASINCYIGITTKILLISPIMWNARVEAA